MLVIRQEQMQAMIAGDETQLESVVADAVRAANPERVKDYEKDVLDSMVKTAVARAKSHDLSKAEDIAAFAAVMFEIAPNFDEQRDIKLVLNDAHFPPAERFYQLFERVPDDAWAEAEKRYDELVWFPSRSAS
ncbi:MAG TPA: hypothetical protein VK468_01625 [Pyrinomonadaceae bacterium]|nr:hypothetical protein [Pyrinomonadaceae bacterium]